MKEKLSIKGFLFIVFTVIYLLFQIYNWYLEETNVLNNYETSIARQL